jgi:hypothetical protein
MSKKVGGVLIKKALHIVTDATDLMYYPFRIWGFNLMVRDLLLETIWVRDLPPPGRLFALCI